MSQRSVVTLALAAPLIAFAAGVAAGQPKPEPQRRVFFVFFAFDRDEISASFEADIREAACHAASGVTAKVRGYADATGAADDNLLLSRRRAVQVANRVARYGVPCDRLKDVQGTGEDHSPGQAENRPFSRRVEILLEGTLPARDVVAGCMAAPPPNPAPPQCMQRP